MSSLTVEVTRLWTSIVPVTISPAPPFAQDTNLLKKCHDTVSLVTTCAWAALTVARAPIVVSDSSTSTRVAVRLVRINDFVIAPPIQLIWLSLLETEQPPEGCKTREAE